MYKEWLQSTLIVLAMVVIFAMVSTLEKYDAKPTQIARGF